MKKSLLTQLQRLLLTAITAGALWACQDEKPEIHFPDPVIPQKEFKHIETLTPDTLTFNQGDSAVFRISTIPYNLLSRQNVKVQVADTAGAKYEFAEIKSYKLSKDSIWNIVLNFKYKAGTQTGDHISIMVADDDTVMYSDETVLSMIPKAAATYYDVAIANRESVAAFMRGGKATLSVRTTPWDMLFADSLGLIALADTLGAPVTDKFAIDSVYFQPKDSTWSVVTNILQTSIRNDYLTVLLTTPDSVLMSNRVNLKRVTIEMTSVKMSNNQKMSLSGNSFTGCLPTVTDFSQEKFLFSHDGDKVTVGDSVMVNKEFNTVDARKPFTVSVWKYDAHVDYTVSVHNTGLPVVRIDTKGKSVTRRDTWVDGMSIRIELPDGTVDYISEDSLSIKGRGNGTWTETNKKPYALKLGRKAKILGMHKQKRWCLLANYKDRTLLRNDAAFWISRHTQMPYTVSGRYVELVWNGKHMGNYYLCEQIRIDNNRVDIAQPKLQDPANGGILIVIDDFLGNYQADMNDKSPMVGFRSTGANNRYKVPYVLKDPDEDENGNLLTSSSPTYQYLFNYVKEMEDAIGALKTNPNNNANVKKYLDYDRAIDYVLIQEMTMNHDSYNTWPDNGPHSAYAYKDSCGLLCYGPVWDFDYHTFTLYKDAAYSSPSSDENSRLYQWELLSMSNKKKNGSDNKYYFSDLAKYDSEFRTRLVNRWNEYKYVWRDSLPVYIDMMADSIRESASINLTVWAENTSLANYRQNGDYNLSFQEAVNAMKTAFRKRWEWIDANITKLGN